MAGLALVVVLAGFARTYFLKGLFGSPPLPLLLQAHGAIMSVWFSLFFAQAALIRGNRLDLHRKVGIAGAVMAAVLIVIALAAARQFMLRSLNDSELLPDAAAIARYDAVVVGVFAALVGAAIAWRNTRPDIHKRLMTLAALSLLGPPLARLIGDENAVLANNLIVLVPIVIDTVRHRRLHPAFGWGGAMVVLSTRAAIVMVSSPSRTDFAVRLVQ
jgi:hypothetical protein